MTVHEDEGAAAVAPSLFGDGPLLHFEVWDDAGVECLGSFSCSGKELVRRAFQFADWLDPERGITAFEVWTRGGWRKLGRVTVQYVGNGDSEWAWKAAPQERPWLAS